MTNTHDSHLIPARRAAFGRRGSMFVETTMGMAIAALAMIAVAQLVAIVSHQRRTAEHIRLATQEAANVMERVMAAPWSELRPEGLTEFELSDEASRVLREPRLSIQVSDAEGDLQGKRIEVALDWRDQSGEYVTPIQLTAWRF